HDRPRWWPAELVDRAGHRVQRGFVAGLACLLPFGDASEPLRRETRWRPAGIGPDADSGALALCWFFSVHVALSAEVESAFADFQLAEEVVGAEPVRRPVGLVEPVPVRHHVDGSAKG